jgi:RHS repeat-associated protein
MTRPPEPGERRWVPADRAGDAAASYAYDPYATVTASTGTGALADANPYRHTTGLLDPATGLVKHGTRWNDTSTGRWTTTDPITRLTDSNQANPYQYAGDNPVNYLDPTGQYSWAEFGAEVLGGIAGAAAGAIAGAVLIETGPGAALGAYAVGSCVAGGTTELLTASFTNTTATGGDVAAACAASMVSGTLL